MLSGGHYTHFGHHHDNCTCAACADHAAGRSWEDDSRPGLSNRLEDELSPVAADTGQITFPNLGVSQKNFFGFKWGDSADVGTSGGIVTYTILDTADRNDPTARQSPVRDMFSYEEATIRDAFAQWAEYADIDFIQVDNPADADIQIAFRAIWGALGYSGFATWQQSDGIAQTADVVIDIKGGSSGLWLHEIGHAIGFSHLSSGSVMLPSGFNASSLKANDLGGVTELYGTVSQPESSGRAFDPAEYLASNPDLPGAGIDTDAEAIAHFTQSGAAEGRIIAFDETLYLEANPDLYFAGLRAGDAALHYATFGKDEGRLLSVRDYIALNPDLETAGFTRAEAAFHYLLFGRDEGRLTSFDASFYRLANPDLAGTSDTDALAHYISFGKAEDRQFFKVEDYLAQNPDLIASGTDVLSLLGEASV